MMNSIERREINSNLALQMVGNAIQMAEQKSVQVSAVVCDPRGHLVALARTDNVMGPAIQYAIDKAWTAANFAISTQGLYDRVSVKPAVSMGFSNRDRVLFFPGGFP
ncbi:MAG: heme-binding protein, partial [Gammaproteobacteria bacterium]|nr:heme-binding protein [Gammaproteobacteria bacterium]